MGPFKVLDNFNNKCLLISDCYIHTLGALSLRLLLFTTLIRAIQVHRAAGRLDVKVILPETLKTIKHGYKDSHGQSNCTQNNVRMIGRICSIKQL